MSNISTVYDRIRTVLASTFPDKLELPNPDRLFENTDFTLKNGFGVVIGGAITISEFDYTEYLEERSINVILTREVKGTDNNISPLVTAKKAILEDIVTIKKLFLKSDQLSIDSSVQIVKSGFVSGVNFVETKDNVIFASVEFLFQVSESII